MAVAAVWVVNAAEDEVEEDEEVAAAAAAEDDTVSSTHERNDEITNEAPRQERERYREG